MAMPPFFSPIFCDDLLSICPKKQAALRKGWGVVKAFSFASCMIALMADSFTPAPSKKATNSDFHQIRKADGETIVQPSKIVFQ